MSVFSTIRGAVFCVESTATGGGAARTLDDVIADGLASDASGRPLDFKVR